MKKNNTIAEIYKNIEKSIVLDLIKFLLEKEHTDPKKISKIWKISIKTAKEYIKEAEKHDFDTKEVEPYIKKIKEEKNVSWYEAVDIFDKNLIRPKRCRHGMKFKTYSKKCSNCGNDVTCVYYTSKVGMSSKEAEEMYDGKTYLKECPNCGKRVRCIAYKEE